MLRKCCVNVASCSCFLKPRAAPTFPLQQGRQDPKEISASGLTLEREKEKYSNSEGKCHRLGRISENKLREIREKKQEGEEGVGREV